MADFDLQCLTLLPAAPLAALVMRLGVFFRTLALEPWGEEFGRGEVGLYVADDLG